MSSNCLWHACQALCVGMLLFSVGGVMSFLGFQADGVLNNNMTVTDTVHYYEDSRSANIKFSKLSYAGPIVMGVGGFIIVAACVMTFEARDSAAKVGPAAFVKTKSTEELATYPIITIKPRERSKSVDVRSIAVQTLEESSSENLHNHLFDKKNLVETFRKFSRTIRKSTSKDEEMHKSPSAPNLLQNNESLKSSLPNVSIVGTRRSSCLPKIRNRVPPALMRQALSIDCSAASPFLTTPTTCSTSASQLQMQPSIASTSSTLGVTKYARKGMYRTITNTSTISDTCYNISVGESGESSHSPSSQSHSHLMSTFSVDRSSGSGVTVKHTGAAGPPSNSGTVDLHLPNGMVTLNVVHTTGASALSGSSTSLRTLSPYPSYQSEDNSSSFDLGSIKSDTIAIPKSPLHSKPPRFRTDSLGRPALMRQSKVDHSEIFCIHDSDEDQKPIPEAEHESDTDAEGEQ
ncbi:unnamed protein product [Orchesella dallaii]